MDQISNLNPAMEVLRRQLAENIERLRKSGKLAVRARTGRAEQQSAAQPESLDAALLRKLSRIDRRSPEGRLQATSVFIESVLAAEFGDALLSDPGLGEMLREISAMLHEDPVVRDDLDRLLSEL